MIGGYPSSVYLLALANEEAGRCIQPRAVYTASETLFDFQREAIERSFGCKAYTYYGNAERCAFIGECPEGKLHLKMEHSYVEFLGDDGQPVSPGQPGRMICTGFGNYATPLIRYDVGDIAVVAKDQRCPCGRSGIILESIVGRTEDYIITPDGRFVGRLDHLFKDASRVRMAQIVQSTVNEIIIRIVREADYSTSDEDSIAQEARLRLGPTVSIRFEYVTDIERTKGGKFPFIVSRIKEKRIFGRKVLSEQMDGALNR
jgi:phenylacetate-CoA ligase